MKRLIAFICAVAVAVVFPFSAAAKSVSSSEHGVEIDFPDDYIVLTTGNLSKNGEFVELYQNTLCASADHIRKAKQTVAIACGDAKALAISGALKTKLINTFITDEYTAKKILEY